MATHQRTRPKSCAICAVDFIGHGNSKYCSPRCQNKVRDARRGHPCSGCGKFMYAAGTVAAVPLCQPCRRAQPGYRDRKAARAGHVWVCSGCSSPCTRPPVRGTRPKWCDTCRSALQNRDIKITPAERVAVYERDGWICWLCEESVDRSLIGSRSHWRPSLDHVLPRAHGGEDVSSNLKLAHWWCNCARSDGRAYSPEDFRVSA